MPETRRRAEIIGWGMYAPERVVTNDDLAALMDTTDDWIRTRTGIERRHIAAEHQATAAMAIEAARAALAVADADPRDIDLVIVGTMTPDTWMPSTACAVQNALGALHAGAVDLNAGCSGFVYALTMAHQAILSGEHELVLVVGADTMSRIVNQEDRATAVLFGDGAGAVLLRAGEGSAGVLATLLGSDGSGADLLAVPAGGSALPASAETVAQGLHYLSMDGRQVFRFAARIVPRAIEQVLERAGLTLDEVDWIIPHQANLRIIEAAAKRLQVEESRFCVNVNEYGNTSAASVPIALCEAVERGQIQPGQQLVLVGFGAGLTWAAAALRWGPSVQEAPAVFYRRWLRWLIYRWAELHTRWLRFARSRAGRAWGGAQERWRRMRRKRE
jgi:3-oxoacyl-[acyl-carrier-protein] synthase-3